jgi:hypothetical protein
MKKDEAGLFKAALFADAYHPSIRFKHTISAPVEQDSCFFHPSQNQGVRTSFSSRMGRISVM